MNKEQQDKILSRILTELKGVEPAQLEELIKQIKEGREDEADVDLVKRVLGLLDWLDIRLKRVREEEK